MRLLKFSQFRPKVMPVEVFAVCLGIETESGLHVDEMMEKERKGEREKIFKNKSFFMPQKRRVAQAGNVFPLNDLKSLTVHDNVVFA